MAYITRFMAIVSSFASRANILRPMTSYM